MNKTCSCCAVSMGREMFSADSRAKDGLQSRCRECANRAKRERYHKDPEAARGRAREYYKNNSDLVCGINAKSREKNAKTVKAGKKRYYDRVKEDPEWQRAQTEKRAGAKAAKRLYDREYRRKNAETLKRKKSIWRSKNKDLIKAIQLNYKHKRRAIVNTGVSGAKLREWVAGQGKNCFWCFKYCGDDFHIDHIVPLARGGRHKLDNLAISCPSCNLRKNAKTPEEFMEQLANERHRVDVGMLK